MLEKDFMSGKVGLDMLMEMPQSRIRELQSSLAQYAQRLHYALDDMPNGDDAFELLFKKAHLRAQGHTLAELAGCDF